VVKTITKADISRDLSNEAKKYIPGGVNSPVRSFKAVGGYPVFVKRAKGSKIYGECGGEFIDYCLSWGALILGHAHPFVVENVKKALENGTSFGAATKSETELAKLIIEAMPSIEKVRLTNSGTEAVMSAIRLARAYTRKNKIIKFEGSYHGHADYLLAKAGSGLASLGIPSSPGVPENFTKHTITVSYNNTQLLEKTAENFKGDLAAIIVEPILANYGVIIPNKGFLGDLRKIADKYNIVLIFDEVITGFRLSLGGAQEYFGVKPDLTCLGKIIGGGLPVGAFGGRKEIMDLLAPSGKVYQAGTLSGNPITVSAGIATLKILSEEPPYKELTEKTERLCALLNEKIDMYKIGLKIKSIGSIFGFECADLELFKRFYHALLKEGIYFSPSLYEVNFLSTAHTDKDIDKTLKFTNMTLSHM